MQLKNQKKNQNNKKENKNNKPLNPFYKNLTLWLAVSITIILIFNLFNQPRLPHEEIVFSDFLFAIEEGIVTEVTIRGDNIIGKYSDGRKFRVRTVAGGSPGICGLYRNIVARSGY